MCSQSFRLWKTLMQEAASEFYRWSDAGKIKPEGQSLDRTSEGDSEGFNRLTAARGADHAEAI